MDVVLRLTGQQHAELKAHLFPGDGKEAVAVAICGRQQGRGRHCLLVRRIEFIPYQECSMREWNQLTWPTAKAIPLLKEAAMRNMAIMKIHSHPNGLACF